MIEEFYGEEMLHDVIFVGDCELYENISPVELWREYGMNSYIRGSAQQLIWQSYYLTEETFRYEKPKAVVFSVLAMIYDEPQSEAYNRMTLDGMKWSMSKVRGIQASMKENEHFIEYVFPILRYHERITDLKEEDFEYLFEKKQVTHNGYYMRVDTKPAKDVPVGRQLGNYHFSDICYTYLDKLEALCRDNGAELILVKAPSLYPYWYDEWDVQMQEYAEKKGLSYYNFLNHKKEIGLNYDTDTYDGGLHLNLSGAEKLSRYFGRILSEKHHIPDRRQNGELIKNWKEKEAAYDAERDGQFAELKKFGKVEKGRY